MHLHPALISLFIHKSPEINYAPYIFDIISKPNPDQEFMDLLCPHVKVPREEKGEKTFLGEAVSQRKYSAVRYFLSPLSNFLFIHYTMTELENIFLTLLAQNQLELASSLLNKKPDLSRACRNPDTHNTALHFLMQEEKADVRFVRNILSNNQSASMENKAGETPFYLAIKNKHADCAQEFLDPSILAQYSDAQLLKITEFLSAQHNHLFRQKLLTLRPSVGVQWMNRYAYDEELILT